MDIGFQNVLNDTDTILSGLQFGNKAMILLTGTKVQLTAVKNFNDMAKGG